MIGLMQCHFVAIGLMLSQNDTKSDQCNVESLAVNVMLGGSMDANVVFVIVAMNACVVVAVVVLAVVDAAATLVKNPLTSKLSFNVCKTVNCGQ